MSETVYWENVNNINSKLLQNTNSTDDTTIEVKELDKFFSRVTEEEDWYNNEEMLICRRYQALVDLLKTHLTDIKVYRIGSCEVNCYILGKTESNAIGSASARSAIAGLSTISVET